MGAVYSQVARGHVVNYYSTAYDSHPHRMFSLMFRIGYGSLVNTIIFPLIHASASCGVVVPMGEISQLIGCHTLSDVNCFSIVSDSLSNEGLCVLETLVGYGRCVVMMLNCVASRVSLFCFTYSVTYVCFCYDSGLIFSSFHPFCFYFSDIVYCYGLYFNVIFVFPRCFRVFGVGHHIVRVIVRVGMLYPH